MLGILSGCGPSGSGDGSEQAASSKGVSGSGGSDAIYKTAGSELTDYAASFLELQEIFEEALKEGIPEEDMDVLRAQMVRTGCDLILATLGPYDVLDLGDEAREEGELMLSGIAAVREKDGNKITFSANHEYTEENGLNKAGDIYSEQGTLDISANTLVYESTTQREGKLFSRTVAEAVILDNGVHLFQYFHAAGSSTENKPSTMTAVFKRYNKDEYSAVTAEFEGETDFTYDSIIGKGDIQTDAMAKNYTVNGVFTVKDGKAVFSKE